MVLMVLTRAPGLAGVGGGGAEGGGEELHGGFDLVAEVFVELNSGDWTRVRRMALMSPSVEM